MNDLEIIGGGKKRYFHDIKLFSEEILKKRNQQDFSSLVGGPVGQAVTKEIFKRDPKALHVLDIACRK